MFILIMLFSFSLKNAYEYNWVMVLGKCQGSPVSWTCEACAGGPVKWERCL